MEVKNIISVKRKKKRLEITKLVNTDSFENILKALFQHNLCLHYSYDDGWYYLVDTQKDKVYYVENYHFNKIDDLVLAPAGETIIFPFFDTIKNLVYKEKYKSFKELI